MHFLHASLAFLPFVALRALIAFNGFSGRADPPMHGDFEAQRHWMEITSHMPAPEWYFNGTSNDLQYWGLDYPPVSAYLAWTWGNLAKVITPQSVALYVSRGDESVSTVVLMRVAVLFTEALLFAFVLVVWDGLGATTTHKMPMPGRSMHVRNEPREFWSRLSGQAVWVASSMHVACALVDHGHTQHNSIALLCTVLWAILVCHSFGRTRGSTDYLAAAIFVVSLNFKQIALYYSLPVFTVHMVRCMSEDKLLQRITRVAVTGCIVVVTQAVLLAPLCTGSRTCTEEGLQLITRVFPTSRGIFEDKVANMWCVLEPFLKTQGRLQAGTITPSVVLTASVLCTLALNAPALWLTSTKLNKFEASFRLPAVLLACAICALGFFLCSVQVHEKSILFPLCAAEAAVWTALGRGTSNLRNSVSWFRLHAIASLAPLLVRDRVALGMCVLAVLLVLDLVSFRKTFESPSLVALHCSILCVQLLATYGHVIGASPGHLPHLCLLGLAASSFAAFVAIWLQFVMILAKSLPDHL